LLSPVEYAYFTNENETRIKFDLKRTKMFNVESTEERTGSSIWGEQRSSPQMDVRRGECWANKNDFLRKKQKNNKCNVIKAIHNYITKMRHVGW